MFRCGLAAIRYYSSRCFSVDGSMVEWITEYPDGSIFRQWGIVRGDGLIMSTIREEICDPFYISSPYRATPFRLDDGSWYLEGHSEDGSEY